MNSEIVSHSSLEDKELARKRKELAGLQTELADRELFLTTLRTELATFEGLYLREVGVLYAELDEWKAKLAESAAEIAGTADSSAAAQEARNRAEESYAVAHGEAAKAAESPCSPEVDSLFREIARQIHPDLTDDTADRVLRTQLMAEANLARERRDGDALKKILENYKSSPESVRGVGSKADLQRVLRLIKQVERRLAQIQIEVEELTSSEIAMLMSKVQDAASKGRDLIQEMANDVRQKVRLARQEYESMPSKEYANER